MGEILHIDTASEELTDEFLLFAIKSGLLDQWAAAFPDPRQWSGDQHESHHRGLARRTFRRTLQFAQDPAMCCARRVCLASWATPLRCWKKAADSRRVGRRTGSVISGDSLRKLLVKMQATG
ncbi:MAG: hypothetical protein WKF84_27595 [Pyrinomonadaceae bacterium]